MGRKTSVKCCVEGQSAVFSLCSVSLRLSFCLFLSVSFSLSAMLTSFSFCRRVLLSMAVSHLFHVYTITLRTRSLHFFLPLLQNGASCSHDTFTFFSLQCSLLFQIGAFQRFCFMLSLLGVYHRTSSRLSHSFGRRGIVEGEIAAPVIARKGYFVKILSTRLIRVLSSSSLSRVASYILRCATMPFFVA